MIKSFMLGSLLLVTLAPAARSAWIAGCPGTFSSTRLPSDAAVKAALNSLLPATLYMRKAKTDEDKFQCIKFGKNSRSADAGNRWLFWPDPPPPNYSLYSGNLTFSYLNKTTATSWKANYTLSLNAPYSLTVIGPPQSMFGAGSNWQSVKLFLSDIGDTYAVFQRCMDDTIIGYYYNGYMFLKQSVTTANNFDWRCMAGGLQQLTSLTGWQPAGWCT